MDDADHIEVPVGPAAAWRNTTHDWAGSVDTGHLSRIRADAAAFAPGGLRHLVLEVVAYAADEAESRGGGAVPSPSTRTARCPSRTTAGAPTPASTTPAGR